MERNKASNLMEASDVDVHEKRFSKVLNSQLLLQESGLKHLSHYTRLSGFLEILKTRVLWATQLQYMNDSREFAIALDLARNKLQSDKHSMMVIASGCCRPPAMDLTISRMFTDVLYRFARTQTC
jgi:hypothetical protein